MKRLILALLFTLPFHVLLAQSAKVIPASVSSSARKEAVIEYNPPSPHVKTEAEINADKKKKGVKCVPGCSGKKQCVRKTSASGNPPPHSEEKASSVASKK